MQHPNMDEGPKNGLERVHMCRELLCSGKASPLDMGAGGCAATDLDGKEERASLSE